MSDSTLSDQIAEQIESKIAFLERANIELSDVVFRQQQDIRTLQTQLHVLIERVQAVQPEERQLDLLDERPPHY